MSDTGKFEPLQLTYQTDIATSARSSQEVAKIYDNWAEDYERRILSYGYCTPAVAAWFFGRYVKPDAGVVLDAGAGTGMMGQVLGPLGYQDITGIDISENMLKVAREKEVYRDLRQMELGKRLDFPDDVFAAVVSTGVFAAGHAPADSFDELIRVIRPGGYVIFSVRTDVYVEGGFKDKQDAFEKEGRWQLAQTSEPFSHLRYEDPSLKVQIFVYRAL